jgi:glucose-1-phosphate cytidylyltransferase
MVEIGGKPILWHIMKIYAHFGFTEFVLALGYKGDMIRDYFLNYEVYNNDVTVTFGNHRDVKVHGSSGELGWKITLAETGLDAMTGARIRQCKKYITEDDFMVTYGDGLANIDIGQLVRYHRDHGKIGTITGVCPPSRFGELVIEGKQVVEFIEKASLEGRQGDINGGFMIFKKSFFDYLSEDRQCVLEKEALETLARNKELMVYHHDGYWQYMDSYRDYLLLQETWKSGNVPWTFV